MSVAPTGRTGLHDQGHRPSPSTRRGQRGRRSWTWGCGAGEGCGAESRAPSVGCGVLQGRVAMKPPFPWFGGKRLAADLIWSRLGDVRNYVTPFFGSGAVELARPHWSPERQTWRTPLLRGETFNDLDANLVNFWRATQADPVAVAQWFAWPISEPDLAARHAWLLQQ